MRAEGLDHLDALGEHVTLGELIRGIGRLLHDDRLALACDAGGELADGHLARSGLHVAEQAEPVVGAEDVFLGEVAVEVEAVEVELLGLA